MVTSKERIVRLKIPLTWLHADANDEPDVVALFLLLVSCNKGKRSMQAQGYDGTHGRGSLNAADS